MFNKLISSAAVCLSVLVGSAANAATTTYTDRTSFEATLDASVTDDYQNAGYVFIQDNATMSGVLGETDYESTGFLNHNIVQSSGSYCAGCNGSFILSFATTSVGTVAGVGGVGFDFFNTSSTVSYNAFVTFGDGSTTNYALPIASTTSLDFFALTSDLLISSIAFGLANGGTTQSGSFGIDNLTIGSTGTVPLPAGLPLLLTAMGVFGVARRGRAKA
ncbi:hypothetical protein PEL8287_03793 [Roseovarius litorisediminis]|uniref:VPLPA-CTERM protein sorting domain-containing protein n=1 Tax=Roseovarius litorisediminis TaxID=1312363 RepID=A0A1Y5TRZ1_9RHOB|nr:VPLPA-CTERM sorting domain-containing protein [Roseovarius litorisediminis]SLN68249.1 hypothetical protein PEL8287_03793 [Roseovarius litorisediminis]